MNEPNEARDGIKQEMERDQLIATWVSLIIIIVVELVVFGFAAKGFIDWLCDK